MELDLIQSKIYELRGQRVMLDFDLAELYQIETKVLKQTVRRNSERFPADFMFEVTPEEYNSLIVSLGSQIVTSKETRGGRRYITPSVRSRLNLKNAVNNQQSPCKNSIYILSLRKYY